MCHSYNKNILLICPILNLQGCNITGLNTDITLYTTRIRIKK
jgi:hypothetical protein